LIEQLQNLCSQNIERSGARIPIVVRDDAIGFQFLQVKGDFPVLLDRLSGWLDARLRRR
jgi:hypothetical protein